MPSASVLNSWINILWPYFMFKNICYHIKENQQFIIFTIFYFNVCLLGKEHIIRGKGIQWGKGKRLLEWGEDMIESKCFLVKQSQSLNIKY